MEELQERIKLLEKEDKRIRGGKGGEEIEERVRILEGEKERKEIYEKRNNIMVREEGEDARKGVEEVLKKIRANVRLEGRYEEKLASGRGSEVARECWEEMREKAVRLGGREREFFRERGKEIKRMEEEREEGDMDFNALMERDRSMQKEERWRRIGESKYNKWGE
ncbi:octapeptide-repeat protein T2-like [Pogonomyrmex barbatus]|uniref:Octapeptide-repeat protein T2-like n=1 Tax=Pogonomyrmex barbatus TaxID=144034 RepID=A0A6I9WKI5_9HYME|nr:octapeptide-repeat protein T2-like [Pogonomyrmex barbatus]